MRRGVAVSAWLLSCALALGAAGCEGPFLANDGTLVFPEKGAHGASVMTANGVEFHDRADVPRRVMHHAADEPWRAPIGFILPASGRFTETSRPTVLGTTGLAIVLRPSDTRVPSWGGEVLVRIDVVAPAAAGTARWGENVVVVLDGRGDDTRALAETALSQLGARDRMTIVDDAGGKVVVPTMPASHRSMALAALDVHLSKKPPGPRDLARALAVARAAVQSTKAEMRVVVISDVDRWAPLPEAVVRELDALHAAHVMVGAVAAHDHGDERALAHVGQVGMWSAAPDFDQRAALVRTVVPPAGIDRFKDVVLSFEGTPAPSHVLEASGGDVRWDLDAGELALGDVRAGDERTEVVRVTVPAWTPGESFRFTVHARFGDVARGGEERTMAVDLPCVYDDDIERIAESRHGDVIAYSSALATLKRLDAAFVGEGVAREGGLQEVARMHAKSMALLARDMHDRAAIEQAELLQSLLDATR